MIINSKYLYNRDIKECIHCGISNCEFYIYLPHIKIMSNQSIEIPNKFPIHLECWNNYPEGERTFFGHPVELRLAS